MNNEFESHKLDVEAYIADDGDDIMPIIFNNFLKNAGHWEEGFNLLDTEIYNLASDALQNDCALTSLLERVLEAIPSIKDIGVEEASQSTQDQTVVALGFFNACTNNLEFFFKDGETMAKIVGVGMQYAKAIFKPGITIEVQEIKKEEWENIWTESGLDSICKIMSITLPTTRASIFEKTFFKKREQEDASHGASSSSNIGSLQGNVFQVPFLWELSKYFIIGKVIDALHLKSNVDTSSGTSKINIIEDCCKEATGSGTTTIEEVAKKAAMEAVINFLSNMRIGSSDPNNNKKGQEGEGGSGDGNDGGDEIHQQGKLPVDRDADKFYTTEVNVQLLHGGDFFLKSETEMIPLLELLSQESLSYQGLKNVTITPSLTLDFKKIISARQLQLQIQREIKITVGDVIFGLHRTCDSVVSHGYFGWFHDELRVSFAPSDQDINNVSLKSNYKPEDVEVGITSNKASQLEAVGTNGERSIQVTGALGNLHVGQLGFAAGHKKGTSGSNQLSNEYTLESPCIQTRGGFNIIAHAMKQREWLEYSYHFPFLSSDATKIEDESYRKELNISPLCQEQKTKFSGTWVPEGIIDMGEPKVAEYSFQAVRNLREIQRKEKETLECSSSTSKHITLPKWKKKRAEKRKIDPVPDYHWVESNPIVQKYEKKLYINHTMSHLVHKEIYRLSQKPTSQQPLWSRNDPLVMFNKPTS